MGLNDFYKAAGITPPPKPVKQPKIIQKGQKTAQKRTEQSNPLGAIIKSMTEQVEKGNAQKLANEKRATPSLARRKIDYTQPVTPAQGFSVQDPRNVSLEAEMAAFDRKLFGKETMAVRPPGVSDALWAKRTQYRDKLAKRVGWDASGRNAEVANLNTAIEKGKIENMAPAQRLELAKEVAANLPGAYDRERSAALISKILGETPNIGGLDDAGLALNAVNQVMQPISTAYTVASKDPRAMQELPNALQGVLTVGDIAAQFGVGAAVGGAPTAGTSMGRLGQLATRYLAMDAPGYAQMIRDSGGVDKALIQFGTLIKDSLDPTSKIPTSQRIQGLALGAAILLGGSGKVAELRGKRSVDAPATAPEPFQPARVADTYEPATSIARADNPEVQAGIAQAINEPAPAKPSPFSAEDADPFQKAPKQKAQNATPKSKPAEAVPAQDAGVGGKPARTVEPVVEKPLPSGGKAQEPKSAVEPSPVPPTKPVEAAKGGAAKEPWEMTREEYASHRWPNRVGDDEMVTVYHGGDGPIVPGKWVTRSKSYAKLHADAKGGKVHSAKVKASDLVINTATSGRQDELLFRPWDGDGPIAQTSNGYATFNELRQAAVSKALSEGKPVPAEVLKDYPDLVATSKRLPVNTPIAKRAKDGLTGDLEFISNTAKSRAFREHGLSGLDVPAQREMLLRVSTAIHDQQIRQAVIKFVPVDVVDNFLARERSPQGLLHDVPVLHSQPPIKSNDSVALGGDSASAIIRGLARAIAEEPNLGRAKLARLPKQLGPTESAVSRQHEQSVPDSISARTDLQPKAQKVETPESSSAEKLPDGVVKVNTQLGVRYGKLVDGELPAFSQLHKTPQEALAYTPPAPKVETPREVKPVGPKLSGKELAEAGAKARAEKSLDNTKVRSSDGVVRTLREHADWVVSQGAKIEIRETRKYYSDKWYKKESQLKEELRKLDIFRPDYQKRAAALKAEIEAGNPKVNIYAGTYENGHYVELTKAQYDYLQSKQATQPKRTAQTKAELAKAFDDFKAEAQKLGARRSPEQQAKELEAALKVVQKAVAHGIATADEFIQAFSAHVGRAFNKREEAVLRKAWEQVQPKRAPAPGKATGLARQFEDPERAIRELDPTKSPIETAEQLAKYAEAEYTPIKAKAELDRVVNGDEPTARGSAIVTYHKRELFNQSKDLYRKIDSGKGDLTENLLQLNAVNAELDQIGNYAQSLRTKFAQSGHALQLAYEPDYTRASLMMRARAANLGERLSPEIEAKLTDMATKLERAEAALTKLKQEKVSISPAKNPVATRAKMLGALADLGIKVRTVEGEPQKVATGGMKGGKQAGAVAAPDPRTLQNKVKSIIRTLAKSYVVEGEHSLSDIVGKISKDVPGLSQEQILRYLHEPYERIADAAYIEKRKINESMRLLQRDAERRSWSLIQKSGHWASQVLGTTSRQLKAGMDLSASLLQGGRVVLTKEWVQSLAPMVEGLTAKNADEYLAKQSAQMAHEPFYPEAVKSGLGVTEGGGSYYRSEELWGGEVIDMISKVPGLGKIVAPLKNSEAAFVAFTNSLRFKLFQNLARLDPQNAAYHKDVAMMINVMTGRGHGKVANALGSEVGGTLLFAPRYAFSQFQAAGGVPVLASKTGLGRRQALQLYGRQIAFMGTAIALTLAQGGSVDSDPRSTNYGKLKLRDGTEIDIFGKWLQPYRLLAQLSSGSISEKGKYTPPSGYAAAGVAGRFVIGKLSPASKLAWSVLTEFKAPNDEGKWVDMDRNQILADMVTPISMGNVVKRWDKVGPISAAQLLGPDIDKAKERNSSYVPPMQLPKGLKQLMGTK